MKTTVSERGQITLPKAIRTSLGIKPGTVLEIALEDGKISAWKREESDSVHTWRGRGKPVAGLNTTDDYLRVVREE
ncbi:MAG: AbrB/MazE/SpoVT family DNA-binding domain-containing protein [Spirochaetaceae bacterium]|nr:MAG: AbrB/MazE/SpoVT family DNA-binding domain-containing protein [Spirochaetaceae bacterium]